MDNNIQTSQSPVSVAKESRSNSIMNLILFVVVGAIIGAGISVSLLFLTKKEEGKIQETRIEIINRFKKDFQKEFSISIKHNPRAVYFLEKGRSTVEVIAIIPFSMQQLEDLLGTKLKAWSSIQFTSYFNPIVLAKYVSKDGKLELAGKIKIYEGIKLDEFRKMFTGDIKYAKDVIIEKTLSNMKPVAKSWLADHDDSYSGFCDSNSAQRIINDIYEEGKEVSCNDTDDEWAAFVPLYDTLDKCFCVDSSGTAKPLNAPCPEEDVTACP